MPTSFWALQSTVHNGRRLNLQRMLDTDANGLPDWWELQYFGHLTGTGSNADPDQDGLGNLSEWPGRNKPHQCRFQPAVDRVIRRQFQRCRAEMAECRRPGPYRLERATPNLLTGFHSTVRTNVTATAPTNTETDAAILPGNARYYRVGVEQ